MRKRNGGFTLTETLIAVVIIIVLCALAFIAVPQYEKKMKQLEFDGMAKEIFIASQNNLTKAVGQGYLNEAKKISFGTKEDDETDVYYLVSSSAFADENSVMNQMLPFGTIDETIRTGGSYIIRYQKSSGLVLDVFYSEPDDKRGCALSDGDYEKLLEIKNDKSERSSYSKDNKARIVGYYGGTEPGNLSDNSLKAPSLRIVNGKTLSVYVKPGIAFSTSENYRLTITGEDSGKTVTYELSNVSPYCDYNWETSEYHFILDDITTDGGDSNKGKFKDHPDFADFSWGENLLLQTETYVKDGEGNITQSAKSAVQKTNSLFAELDGHQVKISNLRHLENLGEDISGFNGSINREAPELPTPVESAVQTTDISLREFDSEYAYIPVTPAATATISYDGGGFTVSGIDAEDLGNAGLFGTLNGGTVENLVLEDFNITSKNGSAGAVVGKAQNVSFSNILVYNNTSSHQSDEALSIRAAKDAGGLVGTMSGGSVENCAAAVYVKADGYAGGLIGSADSVSKLASSYSGGHTVNARYLQQILGAARINVQGTVGAGGLVGNLENTSEVSYSYSTCSVSTADSGCAGGFTAKATDTLFKHCYTTAFVECRGTCENYIGNATNCSFKGNNYYLTNLSPKVDNTLTDVKGVSGKDNGMPDFIFTDAHPEKRMAAYIYDDTLKVDYGGKYYFPTVEQLHKLNHDLDYSSTYFTRMHYGDWQVPYLDTLVYSIQNKDTLYLDINPEKLEDKEYFIFSIEGETSNTKNGDYTIFYRVRVKDNNAQIVNQGSLETLADGSQQIKWAAEISNRLPIDMIVEEKGETTEKKIIITLDDVTSADNSFHKLFSGTHLIPGENIIVRLVIGNEVGVNEIMEVQTEKANSLFANGGRGANDVVTSLSDGTACLGYVRHIQNLNTAVSGIGKDTFKKAVLLNDIDWNGCKANYPEVYASGTKLSSGNFPGLINLTITEFDGRNRCLENFIFEPGFFKTIDHQLNIHDLELLDCAATSGVITPAAANGVLVGTVSGKGVTGDTILVHNTPTPSEDSVKSYSVKGDVPAGGLVGSVSANGGLTLKNSSASVLVSSTASAGGLVGENSGTLVMDSCYVGGHTVNEKYSSQDYNIVSSAGNAGGLIAANSGTAQIKQTFDAASVSGHGASGGLVGSNTGTLSIQEAYTVARVKDVSCDKGAASTVHGAGIGKSTGTIKNESVYFLPELYVGNDDMARLGDVDFVGSGTISSPADYAYYQRNDKSNQVSAKIVQDTMQTETLPYDKDLANREYPFSIWTSFPNEQNIDEYTYYGDWEPLNAPETEQGSIEFSYVDPLRTGPNGGTLTVSLSNSVLGTQDMIKGVENRFLLPSTPYYPGYEVHWTVYANGAEVPSTEVDGMLIVSAADCVSNLNAVGYYVKSVPNTISVTFFYDPSGAFGINANYQDFGKPKALAKGTTWGDFMSPSSGVSLIHPKTINGYRFVGWFKDIACTDMWEDDDVIGADSFAFAKYEKLEFYTITIDFLYEIEEKGAVTDAQSLAVVPRYSLEDQPQYRIVQPVGTPYEGTITLPKNDLNATSTRIIVASEAEYEHANCGIDSTTKQPVYESNVLNNSCTIQATDTAHFQVIYTIPAEKAKVDVGLYRIVYRFHDTASNASDDVDLKQNVLNSYSEDHVKTVYPFGENTYQSLNVVKDGDEYKAVIPTVNFEPMEYYTCTTTQDSLEETGLMRKDDMESVTETGQKLVYYDLIVDYERKTKKVNFKTGGGIPDEDVSLSPMELKIGQPFSKSILDEKTLTRSGYQFVGWGEPYEKGDVDKVSIVPASWSSFTMPDYNVEFKASWSRENIPYTVIIWREKVTDDRDATDAEKEYDFVSSEVRTVKNIGGTATLTTQDKQHDGSGDYQGFHFNSSKSDTSNVTIKSDGTTVLNAYYDRNMIYYVFRDQTPDYVPTAAEQRLGKNAATGETIQGVNARTGNLVDLTFDAASGKWGYYETIQVPDGYYGKSSFGLTNAAQFYESATDNEGTQYGSNGQRIYYIFLRWRTTDAWNGTEYRGDRYKITTLGDELTNTTVYYKPTSGNITYVTIGSNQIAIKDTDGKYYLYNITYRDVTQYVETSPVTKVYRGLYGQDITKYNYHWPRGPVLTTTYYSEYDAKNKTGSGTGASDSSQTFLGQFKFPSNQINKKCVVLGGSGAPTSSQIYFVKQNEDGNYPEYYSQVPDAGNGSGSLSFTEKFEGYHYVEYTNQADNGEKTSWTKINSSSATLKAVRFERLRYPVNVYYGYITPNDGIIFPAYGQNTTQTVATSYTAVYEVATDNDGTQYGSNGREIYYRQKSKSSAWNWYTTSSNVKDKDLYTGTNRYKKMTAAELTEGQRFFALEGGTMKEKTVPSGKKLVKVSGGYSLQNATNIDPKDFIKTLDVRFDTPITVSGSKIETLSGDFTIPSTLSTLKGYTWDGVVYTDDKCTEFFEEGDVERVPSATKPYFICYIPPYQSVKLNLTKPEDAAEDAEVTWVDSKAVTYNELRVKSGTDQPNVRELRVLQGFDLDGYITDNGGDYLPCYTLKCDGYEFGGWATTENAAEEDFYSSKPVEESIELFPVWEKIQSEKVEQFDTIRVHHVNEKGESILPTNLDDRVDNQPYDNENKQLCDYQEFTVQCGTSVVFNSLYFDEYFPTSSIKQQFISYYDKDVPNRKCPEITFVYKEVTTWNYSVDYMVRYHSFEDGGGLSGNVGALIPAANTGMTYKLGDTLIKPAYSQYQSVMFELPEDFGAYNLEKIVFEKLDENGNPYPEVVVNDKPFVVIDKGETSYSGNGKNEVWAKITFYLEPDPYACVIGDRYAMYNGEGAQSIIEESQPIYKSPDGVRVTAKKIYSFMEPDGTPVSAEKVKDSGNYRMNGCVVLEVTEEGKETKRYLMYKDISGAMRYSIQPRPVTLVSDSASKTKDGSPLIADHVTESSAAGTPAFPTGEGLNYKFSADSFRLTPGTTDNSFIYSFKEGTKPSNYFITVKYGTLTVR